MPSKDRDNFRNLLFSQLQGYEVLPGPLALGEINDDARRELWDLIYKHVDSNASQLDTTSARKLIGYWREIALDLHSEIEKKPIQDFKPDADRFLHEYRAIILDGEQSVNKVFDILEIIMRNPGCPAGFTEAVKNIFKRRRLAYYVDTNGPATIFPMATRQEGVAIRDAVDTLQMAGLAGAEVHLRKAQELIDQGDWSGSIRESIHVVESVARRLDPESSKTLGPALKSLEAKRPLHSALKLSFEKLYGYTSDEEGIRHPLINCSESPSGRDEALFMLSACAAFASYLWRVNEDIGE